MIAAIALAVLYFALIELVLIDSARELSEARRFRARVVAWTLAENGAELAARNIVAPGTTSLSVSASDGQGTVTGTLQRTSAGDFELEGEGTAAGLVQTKASVWMQGRVEGSAIRIYFTTHKP